MSEPSIIFDEVNERQGVFTRRVFLLGGLTAGTMGVLTGRLAQLQLVQNKGYLEQAKANQFHKTLIIPQRGLIVDRNDVVLASNRPNFRVMLTPANVPDIDAALAAICTVLGISDERREALRNQIAHSPKYTPIEIAEDLTWEQFSAVNVRTPELPGVTASAGDARVYPYGGAFAHVIGYVQPASKADLDATKSQADALTMNPAFRIGKSGIERSLELQLRGKAGAEMDEVDARGRVIARRPEEDIPATRGATVMLTIDADVQNRAMEMFGEDSGAAVMMDLRNGDLLCLASAPSFDANAFVKGVPSHEYTALLNYDHKPLYNKAITGTYHPGSTFKMTVSLAALDMGVPPSTTHTCNKAWAFGNHVFHCDEAHGTLNMHDAIKHSCDIYFYQTALVVGPDKMAAMARRLGLGGVFDIGITGQTPGLVPDQAWKRALFKNNPNPQSRIWYPGETPSYGIGQGALTVNALEQCVMVSRLANGNKALMPRLIRAVGGVERPAPAAPADLNLPPDHIDFIHSAMWAVVNDGGTAAGVPKIDLGPIMLAGKTGTAQVQGYAGGIGAHGAVGAWDLRDHAWFVCFAPADDPRYAMSVLVEHGGFGADAAAPKAREIMRVALMKDPDILARIKNPSSFKPPAPVAAPAPDAATPAPAPEAAAPADTSTDQTDDGR